MYKVMQRANNPECTDPIRVIFPSFACFSISWKVRLSLYSLGMHALYAVDTWKKLKGQQTYEQHSFHPSPPSGCSSLLEH